MAAGLLPYGSPAARAQLLPDDPLGPGEVAATPPVAAPSPRPPDPAPQAPIPGEILTAISGVRELAHDVAVVLVDGLAVVSVQIRLRNDARQPSTIDYKLALPEDAVPVSMQSCTPACRAATLPPSSGSVLALPIPSVAPESEIRIVVHYVVPAPLHAGVVRVLLPARGHDPRAAPWSVRASSADLLEPLVEGASTSAAPWTGDPRESAEIVAGMRTSLAPLVSRIEAPCDGRTCIRTRTAASPAQPVPVSIVLLVDVSPSTRGPLEGRRIPALGALLARAPEQAQIYSVAFAARASAERAQWLGPDARLSDLLGELPTDLGPATRLASAWPLVEDAFRNVRGRQQRAVAVLGDGCFGNDPSLDRVLARAERSGVQIHVLNIGDRPACPLAFDVARRTGGTVIELSRAIDASVRRADPVLAEEPVAALFAPRAPSSSRSTARAGEDAVTFTTSRLRRTHARTRGLPPGLAQDIRDDLVAYVARPEPHNPPPAAPSAPTNIPAESLLALLRQRVIPVARRCLRSDRRGRARYSVRATFEFDLAEREIVDVHVQGELRPELRGCLLGALETLELPPFDGTIHVRYPVHTEPETPPPRIELPPGLAATLDQTIEPEEPAPTH